MIDEAARGRTVFYRFYSEVERRQSLPEATRGCYGWVFEAIRFWETSIGLW